MIAHFLKKLLFEQHAPDYHSRAFARGALHREFLPLTALGDRSLEC